LQGKVETVIIVEVDFRSTLQLFVSPYFDVIWQKLRQRVLIFYSY